MRVRRWIQAIAVTALMVSDATPDGVLDPNFGGGIVTTGFAGPVGPRPALLSSVALQPDGRVVAVGHSNDMTSTVSGLDMVIARYEVDGSLDPKFGNGGRVVTNLGGHELAKDVVVLPDGRILVVGEASRPASMLAVQYLSDGSLDPSFGSGGVARYGFPGHPEATAVALQTDGQIVICGNTSTPFPKMTVLRLSSNGALDEGFGSSGIVTMPSGSAGFAFDLAIQADGKIVVAGHTYSNGAPQVAVIRLTKTGAPDGTFGTGGLVETNLSEGTDAAHGVAVQADGRIIVAGYAAVGAELSHPILVRYAVDGNLDGSFGTNGVVFVDTDEIGLAEAIVIQPDAKISIAGGIGGTFMLARFGTSGILDESFGKGGVVRTSIPTGSLSAIDLLVPFPGALLAAGRADSNDGQPTAFALARYSATTPIVLETFAVE